MPTSQSAPNWYLIALTPELGDINFPINISMRIGRQDSNDVVLATPQISRQHAKFNQVGNHLFIQDLGSSNGTFVNGERISTQAVEVQPNDEIAFADLVFVVATEVMSVATPNPDTHDSHTVSQPPVQSPAIVPEVQTVAEMPKITETPVTEAVSTSVYAITDTATPSSDTALAASMTASPSPTSSTPTEPAAVVTPMPVPVTAPIAANAQHPISPTTPNPTSQQTKKSPLLWLIALIILLVVIGVVVKGL